MASDEPRYQTEPAPSILTDSGVEIRRYERVLIASVRVQSPSWRDASSAAFRPLANYIFGGNERGEQIGMTTPVTTHQTELSSGAVWEVRFFMPPRYEADSLPRHQNPYVTLDEQAEARFAVMRFSGPVSNQKGRQNFASHEARLRELLARAGLPASAPAHYAVYNGPWTPAMMRRNEVLIPLE